MEVFRMLLGIDAGNFETKVVTREGAFKFVSTLGEWREFNIDTTAGADDIEYEYEGQRGFAGTLAQNESLFVREMGGDSKAHEDAKIRILIAIYRYATGNVHDIVVGQPIRKHKAEKGRIIAMLKGRHTITVNGVTKSFEIRNVAVAPEGAGAYWAYRGNEKLIRIVDVGSATVNCATVNDGRFVDRDSFTLAFGANSEENFELERLAEAIIARSTKRWEKSDCVRVCGGIAEKITPLLARYFTDVQTLKPMLRQGGAVRVVQPVFANAVGFYELGRALYDG
jgi:plasmid segregation protein ParM